LQNFKLKLLKLFFLLFTILLFNSCANIVAPSGGLGNQTPPIVKNASINQAQTNFSDNKITLEFDKFMNRNSVTENIIIAPTTKFSHKWNAKKITISFAENLKENTTYSIQIGGAFSDFYGNIAKEPFFIYFSTGNIIDTGKIEGRIITEKPEGFYIFCYILDDFSDEIDDFSNENLNDCSVSNSEINIDFLTQIPDYKVQIGTNGNFTVPALKDGNYRVIAVKDVDRDGTVTQLKDTVGLPIFDSKIQNGTSDFVQIIPSKIVDIMPPEVFDLRAKNQNEISVIFSEQIILDSFDINSVFLTQRDDTNRWFPAAFYVENPNEIKEITLAFRESLKSEKLYNLNFDSTKNHTVRDLSGNILVLPIKNNLVVSTDSVPFPLTVKNFPIPDSAKNISTDTNFILTFSNPIVFNSEYKNEENINEIFANKIKLFDNSKKLELNFSQPQIYSISKSNKISFVPKQKLEPQKMYKIEINCSDLVDIWENILVDTLTVLNFETARQRNFSRFSGQVVADFSDCNFPKYLKIKLKSGRENSVEYIAKIGADNTFLFPQILAGEYEILYFCDLNENGKFDLGSLIPFEFSEPFSIIEQTVTIRERWNLDDFPIEIFRR